MRRIKWIAAIIVSFSVLLAGCGTKDAGSVVKDLDKVVNSMESYQGSGTMTLHTGQEPLTYQVDVSFQKPKYYRIALTNPEKDITQIVLRNDDGVFVLTPHLNKSFRFQSDWPDNQGQVYLYQTLVQSILLDNSRQFAADENNYVFDVMANYQNGSLARQKIWLSKDDYKPQQVQVSDANNTVMVEVKFTNFEFDKKFDSDAFDMKRNMGPATGEQKPTEADPNQESEHTPDKQTVEEEGGEAGNQEQAGENANGNANGTEGTQDKEETDATTGAATGAPFVAMEPSYMPEGVALLDMRDIKLNGNKGLMTRYTGAYDYTLIQAQQKDRAVALVPGRNVDLGHTIGLVTGEEPTTLTWTYDGMEYRLSSADLPESEMIKISQSVLASMSK
ncbi:LolA family protein [Paenibacillus daejeonensis]|uniref:LolA family protein n=1 Tax=Paenibacillus daejeonensis TaxID=135193 RepID=UPI00035FC05F|nr:outer membrane lipoprotein carrier protein LolA [Paenibacillus daejeonensis]